MSRLSDALLAELDDRALDELAKALAPRIASLQSGSSPEQDPWLNAKQAASYLGCTPDRIYDLSQLCRLQPRRDGRRLLFRRSDLDRYLEESR
jgi:excisionase family DNA binding protein